MEGALGLAELEKKDKIVKSRMRVGKLLNNALSDFENFFQLPKTRKDSEHIFMLYPIVIKDKRVERDDFLLYLEENGLETRLFMPLLNQPIYKKMLGDLENLYPVAKYLVERGFIIGSHPYLTSKDIAYVRFVFNNYLKNVGLI